MCCAMACMIVVLFAAELFVEAVCLPNWARFWRIERDGCLCVRAQSLSWVAGGQHNFIDVSLVAIA